MGKGPGAARLGQSGRPSSVTGDCSESLDSEPKVQVSDPSLDLIPFDTSLLSLSVPVGGRLRLFINNWHCITADAWILSTVSGYALEFIPGPTPVQTHKPNPIHFSPEEQSIIDSEVAALQEKQAISSVPPNDYLGSFISQLFLHLKKMVVGAQFSIYVF